MKALIELPSTAIGIIIGLVGILVLLVAFGLTQGLVTAAVQDSAARLTALDAVHALESCLRGGTEVIEVAVLDQWKGKSGTRILEQKCGILSGSSIGAKVEDLQSGRLWQFGFTEDEGRIQQGATVIQSGGERHVARLVVQIT